MITLRTEDGMMVASFSDRVGMRIIDILFSEGRWSTYIGAKSREVCPCFRIKTPCVFQPLGNDEMKIYIWEGYKFILNEVD